MKFLKIENVTKLWNGRSMIWLWFPSIHFQSQSPFSNTQFGFNIFVQVWKRKEESLLRNVASWLRILRRGRRCFRCRTPRNSSSTFNNRCCFSTFRISTMVSLLSFFAFLFQWFAFISNFFLNIYFFDWFMCSLWLFNASFFSKLSCINFYLLTVFSAYHFCCVRLDYCCWSC